MWTFKRKLQIRSFHGSVTFSSLFFCRNHPVFPLFIHKTKERIALVALVALYKKAARAIRSFKRAGVAAGQHGVGNTPNELGNVHYGVSNRPIMG